MIPIRTDAPVRLTPYANYALLALNVLVFAAFHVTGDPRLIRLSDKYLALNVSDPSLYQFVTSQFLHADLMHLAGNMIFLWVFGNAVNDKMGNVPYLLFYLAGGVFAAWGFAVQESSAGTSLLGASGAIAAVTAGFLVLFPRSHIKVLYFFFIIGTFEIPAILLIVAKIILWDNVIAPGLEGGGNVAHGAHLAGNLFGFVATLLMLAVHAVGRDHFDLLSLWDRANRRRQWRTAMAAPGAREQATYGRVARASDDRRSAVALPDPQMDRIAELRERISGRLADGDVDAALQLHQSLILEDPRQCLPEREQLRVAREYYRQGRFPQAAAAFNRFLDVYKHSTEAAEVRLLLGIVYARDLRQYEAADEQLSRSLADLAGGPRRDQCFKWLQSVRAALGRPAPEG
ncbi:MAG: rhomboid family intramembrane serine protease [Phycisphaerales bacterium]|nr:MAG: rhomboid family intramembrane serine protease [Phycisphaerales bacterium]